MKETAARSAEQEVLRLAGEVGREMRPARAETLPRPVEMGSSLERDLGLDSLGRAELVARLERAFGVRLPEELLGSAETPADLARALQQAGVEGARAAGVERTAGDTAAAAASFAGGPAEAAPRQTRSLVEVLEWHAERHPGRRHLLFYAGGEAAQELTYGDLLRRARQVAAGLEAAGVERCQAVALMLPSGHDYFVAFYGALLAGGVPVPLYPPARRSQIEDHLRRQAGILIASQAVALITFPEVMTVARLLRAQVLGLGRVLTVAELEAGGRGAGIDGHAGAGDGSRRDRRGPAGDDVALLQFTSGSTGRPKGVVLTHANLLAQLRALGVAVGIGPQDVVVSWLPLYHDMGLIGAWMASLYYGMPLVLMSPLGFLAHPARWLQLLSRHRGTLSAAPNFAYELCARKVADDELAGIDLSAWRFALNGAEPVSADAILRFIGRFRAFGFRPEAMAPVYGLAENSLALTIPPLGRGAVVDVVEREAFERTGRAAPVVPGPALLAAEEAHPAAAATEPNGGPESAASARVLRFVGCGMPLPEHELRIVDAAGHEAADRQEGRLQFRGPSATSGYFRDSEATHRLRQGDWLDSGDRAYVVGREVFLTGRDKDIIIRAGRNLHPHDLEEAVGAAAGIRKGCVAVFGVPDRETGAERLVVLAETRETREAVKERLREAVQDATVAVLGEPADEVVLAPPHAVPKTSSGKVRRAASRELYLAGRIGKGGAALGLQLARLALAGARVQLGRAGRAAWAPLYSAYVWAIFGLVGAPLWLAVALLPGLGRRRRLTRAAARLMFRCTGIPLHTSGLEHLADCGGGPSGARREAGCVVAVNHASYLDAVALTAMLPPDFAYVAKRELEDSLLTRVMMRRLGALLVERFDAVQSAGEVPKAAAALAGGESLVIFPEGTFRRAAGLRSFRLGGFLAAAQAGAPVLPAALRGTRHVFRDAAAIFRRGAVEVEVLPPIWPDGDDWAAGLRLRDRVRAAMLERLELYGEPDLAVAGGRD
jgi:1-acyl-sn-glycerol-3-phosphate acyltransferase